MIPNISNEVNASKNQKYIICDTAVGFWGKTETLLEVIRILKPHLKSEKDTASKDKWCEFDLPNGDKVVVSTLGDPNSAQPAWLLDAANTNARFIVTACRTSGFTVDTVYDIAQKFGYEIIWFKNFHFDSISLVGTQTMNDIRHQEAQCIVETIKIL